MPATGIKLLPRNHILSFSEITKVVQYGVEHGITKVRLTGGEPLVRRDIVKLVEMVAQIDGITDLAMTTNGTLLKQYATDLAKAGLMRINISLDTLDAEKFSLITRGGHINDVLAGIDAAEKAGLNPIKINCVIKASANEPDAQAISVFAAKRGFQVRFIRQMDLKTGEFYQVDGGSGGDCSLCNRLRLTANGYLKPCLFGNMQFSVRELGIAGAYQMALNKKPVKGKTNQQNEFYNIGG